MVEQDIEKYNREGVIKVHKAREGMAYCIIELDDVHGREVIQGKAIQNADGEGVIWFGLNSLREFVRIQDGLIVFIDGALIKKEALEIDYENNYIKVRDMEPGQEFVVIQDKKHDLMFESMLTPAYNTPYIDESLVFFNGKLILNDTAIKVYRNANRVRGKYHNEVKMFDLVNEDGTQNLSFKVWNEFGQNWLDCTEEEVAGLESFYKSYSNGLESIALNIDRQPSDDVNYWIYQYARTAERPLHIYHEFITEDEATAMWEASEHEDEYGNKMVFIPTDESYTYGANSLEVYFDGVRQYDRKDFTNRDTFRRYEDFGIMESPRGDGFFIKGLFWGDITYVIEHPAAGVEKVCEREILDHGHITGTSGVYETTRSLIPGMVNVYINGLRQSRDSFVVLDNNHIMLKNQFQLTGHIPENRADYLTEPVMISDRESIDITYDKEDFILVEVVKDYRKKQGTVNRSYKVRDLELAQRNLIEFNTLPGKQGDNLSNTILSTTDEIKIYVNGLFTGYRRHEGYRVNDLSNTIVIIARNLSDHIFTDDLYEEMLLNPRMMQQYLKDHDLTEEDYKDQEITNVFTLEWR